MSEPQTEGADLRPDPEPSADDTVEEQGPTAGSRVRLPQTGDQRVDEALEPLADVQDLPPAEQVEVYVGVHRALQDRLADLEG